jgi:hypothetical protein
VARDAGKSVDVTVRDDHSFGDANEARRADTGTDYLRILDFNRVCKKYK